MSPVPSEDIYQRAIVSAMYSNIFKVAVCHPRLGRGGSEARAMWALQALKDEYDVTLITGGGVDLEGLNRFYGTSLKGSDFAIRQAPVPLWLSLRRRLRKGDALDGAAYQRFCRSIAGEFDVLISAYNLCDFGVPGIQCIADFSYDDKLRRLHHPSPPGLSRVLYEDNSLRRTYLRLAKLLARPSGRDLFAGEDLILANSWWTADLLYRKYGIRPSVLYPPVTGRFPDTPWAQKEHGFVCLGRIDPVKRIERMVDILDTVRRYGHDLHLHIVGRTGDDAYGRTIAGLCKAHAEWVIPEGPLFGPAKTQLLAGHRFGIHGCNGEAFGIAVAEMVKAGCIVFVPKEGAPAEIVNHPLLTYETKEDAVRKIGDVLQKQHLQDKLRSHLAIQGRRFSAESFMAGLRTVVQQFLALSVTSVLRLK